MDSRATLLRCLLALLLSCLASCAQVHTGEDELSGSALDKIPADIERAVRAGEPQDVLVELTAEASTTTPDADVSVSTQGLARDPNTLPPSLAEAQIAQDVAARALHYQTAQDSVLAAISGDDLTLLQRYENVPFLFVSVRNLTGLYALANHADVLRLHAERFVEASAGTSNLTLIEQPAVLAAGETGAGTTVAVLDTGVDYTRAAFGSCKSAGPGCKVAYVADLAKNDSSLDDSGHGTNVSAIVLAVAPEARVLGLDVFAGSTAPSSAITAAVDWVIEHRTEYGTVAMNLSLGSGQFSALCADDVFASSLKNARAAGIMPIVASGNSGYSTAIASPACAPAAVSVGAVYDTSVGRASYSVCSDATTAADKVTCFSNSASFISLLAPGAAVDAGGYRLTGTSQAAPHVAGAFAVMRAAFPDETLNQSLARLTDTGPELKDARNGAVKHRLDLKAALAAKTVADTTPPTGTVTIGDDAANTKATAVTLKITASDAAGVTRMCVSNTTTCTSYEAFAATKSWTLTTGDGVKTVRVTLEDPSGNRGTVSDDIRLDTTAPSGGTLTATPASKQVALSWTAASDAGSGVASYRLLYAVNAAVSCSTGTQIYQGSARTFTHAGLTNGTVYGYRVCPIDNVGNTGSGSAASAKPAPEFTPPVGALKIGDGSGYVRSSAVTLTITASDPGGVSSMCISNTNTCARWENFATTKAWTLSTGNTSSVYAWFKDSYGNTNTTSVSASSVIDSAAPSGGTLSASAGVRAAALRWTNASDDKALAGYKLVFVTGKVAPGSCSTGAVLYMGTNLSYSHTGLNPGATYSYRLCAYDRAGNLNVGSAGSALIR